MNFLKGILFWIRFNKNYVLIRQLRWGFKEESIFNWAGWLWLGADIVIDFREGVVAADWWFINGEGIFDKTIRPRMEAIFK